MTVGNWRVGAGVVVVHAVVFLLRFGSSVYIWTVAWIMSTCHE
jgi:hypothetical protein